MCYQSMLLTIEVANWIIDYFCLVHLEFDTQIVTYSSTRLTHTLPEVIAIFTPVVRPSVPNFSHSSETQRIFTARCMGWPSGSLTTFVISYFIFDKVSPIEMSSEWQPTPVELQPPTCRFRLATARGIRIQRGGHLGRSNGCHVFFLQRWRRERRSQNDSHGWEITVFPWNSMQEILNDPLGRPINTNKTNK